MIRLVLRLILYAFVFWVLGLLWFIYDMSRLPNLPAKADAVVVLTGGTNRVEKGLELLQGGFSNRLFISGVSDGVSVQDILKETPLQEDIIADVKPAIELGYKASNTRENAQEVIVWTEQEQIKTIILVTSNYHMRRSMLELSKLGLDTIQPYAVKPVEQSPKVVALEYSKWLFRLLNI